MEMNETPTRLGLNLNEAELGALDELCAADMRSRPLQLKWLITQEAARRKAAPSEPKKAVA